MSLTALLLSVQAMDATIPGPERYLAGHPLMIVTLVFVEIVGTLVLTDVLAREEEACHT